MFHVRRFSFAALSLLVIGLALGAALRVQARSPGQDNLDRGTVLYRQGRYTAARTAFEQAAHQDPGLLLAWENLGWAHYKNGDPAEARRLWHMVLKVDPGNARLTQALGDLDLETARWQDAVDQFRRLLVIRGDVDVIRLKLGAAYEGAGQWDQAALQYRGILQKKPHNFLCVSRLARVYGHMGRQAAAIALVEQYLSRKPAQSRKARRLAARLYAARGGRLYGRQRYAQACAAYRAALAYRPRHAPYLANLGWAHYRQQHWQRAVAAWQQALDSGYRHRLARNIALAYLHGGDTRQALVWYMQAADNGQTRHQDLLNIARIYFRQKDSKQALLTCRQLLHRPGADAQWARRLARLFIEEDALEQGTAFFEDRLRNSGSRPALEHALARIYAASARRRYIDRDYDRARKMFASALAHDPNTGRYYRDLGWTCWQLEQWGACEKVWRRYAARFKGRPEPWNLLTGLYLRRSRYRQALATAATSLALQPDQPDQRLNLARAHLALEHYRTADRQARDLARAYPGHLAIQVFFGDILMQRHDFSRGLAQWQRVLKMGGHLPRARYYRLKCLYEQGAYDEAVAEARQDIEKHGPRRLMLQFLRDDAIARGDQSGAIEYQKKLLSLPAVAARKRPWLDLATLYIEAQQYGDAARLIERALVRHPGYLPFRLKRAYLAQARHDYRRSLERFRRLYHDHPDNRNAYMGVFDSLVGSRGYAAALQFLNGNRCSFFTDHDRRLKSIRLAARLGDNTEAAYAALVNEGYRQRCVYVPVLLYHGITSGRMSGHNLPRFRFEDHLKALQAAGYTAITVSELKAMADGKRAFPAKPILITFDDARIDSFVQADPLLKKYALKATMFVPTAGIRAGHPFQADWKMIAAYRQSGRWDIQAHGHHAHDNIPVNASGRQGKFLVDHKWLAELHRSENTTEFTHRVHQDYRRCIRSLKQHLGLEQVVGYAFPYSEAGQEQGGSAPEAWDVNRRAIERYFRFGFIQDASGYNRIVVGAQKPRFLRRYIVMHTMDGRQLLAHLVRRHPLNLARLAQARNDYYQGRYWRAEERLQALVREHPLLAGQARLDRAATAYAQGRFHKARYLLQRNGHSAGHIKVWQTAGRQRLLQQVLWATRPHLGMRVYYFRDSDQRRNVFWSTPLAYPLKGPFDLWLTPAYIEFHEGQRPALYGRQATAGVRWRGLDHLILSASLRRRNIGSHHGRVNAWLKGRYVDDRRNLALQLGHEDVDTLSALLADIAADRIQLAYRRMLGVKGRVHAATNYTHYTDGNQRVDVRLGYRRNWHLLTGLKAGVGLGYSHAARDAPQYYTPRSLRHLMLNLFYDRHLSGGWKIDSRLGLGAVDEAGGSPRLAVAVHAKVQKDWSGRWRTFLAFDYATTPTYDSSNLTAGVTFRF